MSVRISVITASLNRRNLLQRAIESVLAQRGTAIEHIIVDGVSTDGTLEMLAAYPHLIVISEPDRCLRSVEQGPAPDDGRSPLLPEFGR